MLLNFLDCCFSHFIIWMRDLDHQSKRPRITQRVSKILGQKATTVTFRSINSTSTACLGWLDISRVIKAKKLIFTRTIACMDDFMPIKRIFKERILEFREGDPNVFDSPIIQILEIACEFQVGNLIRNMFAGTLLSKQSWKKLIWDKAWELEKVEWDLKVNNDKNFDLIKRAMNEPGYSIWWSIADCDQSKMRQCEVMVKLLTHTSLLKGGDCRLKRLPFGSRMCTQCALCSTEDANHVIMQCPIHERIRVSMFNEINAQYTLEPGECNMDLMLGNYLANKDFDDMLDLWCTTSRFIYIMYRNTLSSRKGVG